MAGGQWGGHGMLPCHDAQPRARQALCQS
jgi:hypothetical protein